MTGVLLEAVSSRTSGVCAVACAVSGGLPASGGARGIDAFRERRVCEVSSPGRVQKSHSYRPAWPSLGGGKPQLVLCLVTLF